MSAHPRGLDLNPDNIEPQRPPSGRDVMREPLVFLDGNGDLLIKPARSDHWIRVNRYGEIKYRTPDTVTNDWLLGGTWMTKVGGAS